MIQAITLVVEPPRYDPQLVVGNFVPAYEFYECSRFAEELRRYTAAPVTLMQDFLHSAPLDGFILLYAGADLATLFGECTEELRQSLPSRLISVGLDRVRIWEEAGEYKLPAAISGHQYFLWSHKAEHVLGYTLHGLHSVATYMGSPILRRRGDYCILESNDLEMLPAFTIRYLEEYARLQGV